MTSDSDLQTSLLIAMTGAVRLHVAGDIDMVTYEQFEAALAQATAIASRCVEVDLAEATFFGSEAARSLSVSWKEGQARGIDVSVVSASPMVRQVLYILDLRPLLAA